MGQLQNPLETLNDLITGFLRQKKITDVSPTEIDKAIKEIKQLSSPNKDDVKRIILRYSIDKERPLFEAIDFGEADAWLKKIIEKLKSK